MITEPGIYELPADLYHAHPALSSSGARKLLPPYCPALFKWHRENQQPPSRVFDFGHAAHKMVLGIGPILSIVQAENWRTKAAQEARDDAYAAGEVPLLQAEFDTVQAMATVLSRHPAATMIMQPGKPEQSLFAKDEATGVMLRARIDWLPDADDGRMRIVDYKTTASAEPAAFARSVARYGYFQQAAWYIDIVRALGLADEVEFVFIGQEKVEPHIVQAYRLDDFALKIGRRLNRDAIELFAQCTKTDTWPTYSSEIEELSLPAWMEAEEEMSL